MAAQTRIYRVSEVNGEGIERESLVTAASQAQAISHVVKGRFAAEVASPKDVARLVGAGVAVVEAGAE